jgi:hypothetical protein
MQRGVASSGWRVATDATFAIRPNGKRTNTND